MLFGEHVGLLVESGVEVELVLEAGAAAAADADAEVELLRRACRLLVGDDPLDLVGCLLGHGNREGGRGVGRLDANGGLLNHAGGHETLLKDGKRLDELYASSTSG